MNETQKELNDLTDQVDLIEAEIAMINEQRQDYEETKKFFNEDRDISIVVMPATERWYGLRIKYLEKMLIPLKEKQKQVIDRREWELRTGNR